MLTESNEKQKPQSWNSSTYTYTEKVLPTHAHTYPEQLGFIEQNTIYFTKPEVNVLFTISCNAEVLELNSAKFLNTGEECVPHKVCSPFPVAFPFSSSCGSYTEQVLEDRRTTGGRCLAPRSVWLQLTEPLGLSCLTGWFTSWPSVWLSHWLTYWLRVSLTTCLTVCLSDLLTGLLAFSIWRLWCFAELAHSWPGHTKGFCTQTVVWCDTTPTSPGRSTLPYCLQDYSTHLWR